MSETQTHTETRRGTTFSAIEAPARSIQRLFVGSWAWFTCALCSDAWAQPREAEAPEENTAQPAADIVVPPRAIGELGAAYPEGGVGEHDCEVQLVVGVDGVPRDVSVLMCPSPFAEAAAAAAAAWRFEPATRGGQPVAAK